MTSKKEPIKAESMLWTTANMAKAIYLTGALCAFYFGLRSEIREDKATQRGVDNVQDTRLDYLEGKKVNLYPMKPDEITFIEE